MESDATLGLQDRLRECIGEDSVSSFARRCGLPEATIRSYLDGKKPVFDKLVKIAKAAGVSLDWLATGRGPKHPQSQSPAIDGAYALVPLYDVRAAAGHGAMVDREQVIDFLAFRRDWLWKELHAKANDLYLIKVAGESMEPTLREGDVILIDPRQANVSSDGIYVLRIDDSLLVKRCQRLPGGKIMALSDNPAYKPFYIHDTPDVAIIGRVVWAGRRM